MRKIKTTHFFMFWHLLHLKTGGIKGIKNNVTQKTEWHNIISTGGKVSYVKEIDLKVGNNIYIEGKIIHKKKMMIIILELK